MSDGSEPGGTSNLLSRRRLLQGLALGGAVLAAGPVALAEPAWADTPDSTTSPLDLRFTITERLRPVEPLSRFHTLDERFAGPLSGYQTLPVSGFAQPATVRTGTHALTASGTQAFGTLWRSSTGQQAPFSTVVVDVAESTGQVTIGAGLARDAGNAITGWWDLTTGIATLEVAVNGTTTVLANGGGPVVGNTVLPARFAVSVCGDQVAAFGAEHGGDWQELAVARVADHTDLRDVALLPYYHNAFAVRGHQGSATLSAVSGGYFGSTGVRDTAAITTPDGAPVITDGWVYITTTNAGLRTVPSAHQGVWRLNLSDYTQFEEVGKFFYQRDGMVLGDSAGKIVVTGPRDLVILTSTWGAFDKENMVNVALNQTPTGTGYEGVHILTESRVLLPPMGSPPANIYDPFIVFTQGHWYMAVAGLSIWRFDPDFTNPVLVGQDAGFYEGPRITRIGGVYYAIWGGLSDFRIYDLQMNFVGFLNAQHPQAPNFPFVNPPHPQIVPVCKGDRTRFVLVTFSGDTGSFGEVGQLVVEDDPVLVRGCEF